MFKKLTAILLTSIMVLSGTVMSFADENVIFSDFKQNFTLERIVEKENVIVLVKSLTGEILNRIELKEDTLYLDGKIISSGINTLKKPALVRSEDNRTLLRAITWGRWQTSSETIATGGLSTAVIAGLIAAFSPWISLRVAGIVAGTVAGKYDQIEIEWKIRYGIDSEFEYYERKTTFYGDEKLIYGPVNDKGKNALDW